MKKIIFILFYTMFLAVYPCKPLIIDYLEEAGIPADSKNLILYTDSVQDFDSNLIFKLDNKLYVYGKEFMTVDDKTYEYLGSGYYRNNSVVYFFNIETAKIKDTDKVKTYIKTKEVAKLKGTSCDGQFHDYFYFLEINNTKYENGKRADGFFASIISRISEFFRK